MSRTQEDKQCYSELLKFQFPKLPTVTDFQTRRYYLTRRKKLFLSLFSILAENRTNKLEKWISPFKDLGAEWVFCFVFILPRTTWWLNLLIRFFFNILCLIRYFQQGCIWALLSHLCHIRTRERKVKIDSF